MITLLRSQSSIKYHSINQLGVSQRSLHAMKKYDILSVSYILPDFVESVVYMIWRPLPVLLLFGAYLFIVFIDIIKI